MQPNIRLSQTMQQSLRCPVCRASLTRSGERFVCTNSVCATRFPIVDGVPVLLNERSSVFSISDFTSRRATYFGETEGSKLRNVLNRLVPSISKNIKGEANYRRLSEVLLKRSTSPRVLVLGGSILGEGMGAFATNTGIDFVETDISFGSRTMLVCDAHDIPFTDASFDGVVVQAVLEHVVDPHRCCEEIHRVLKNQGVVYAETPFIQQVHGGRYDFTRFTHLGHRRLFRKFEEIDSGAACGPGMALAWSYRYFLLSFTTPATPRVLRSLLMLFASFTSFYLKYFDHYLINKPGALDAASAYYFMGTKSNGLLPDRDLLKFYKGMDLK